MARLIDANAVDYENIMCSQSQLHWLNAIIEKQPTVDAVEVVHGRWLKIGVEAGDPFDGNSVYCFDVFACSECGCHFDVSEAMNYCPNCGAKMDGDGNA